MAVYPDTVLDKSPNAATCTDAQVQARVGASLRRAATCREAREPPPQAAEKVLTGPLIALPQFHFLTVAVHFETAEKRHAEQRLPRIGALDYPRIHVV